MAAPLGFKTFNTGDILSASDTNGYLMQGVLVFADAAARSAAITSPQEGQTSYLKDTDVIQVYSGSAWVTKSGGSSPLTTKGDLYTYSTTDARLAVGTNGHTLVADSSTATGLAWAAPAGGAGLTLIDEVSFTASSTINVNDVFSSTYTNYRILISGSSSTGSDCFLNLRFRVSGTDTTTNYKSIRIYGENSAAGSDANASGTDDIPLFNMGNSSFTAALGTYDITKPNVAAQSGVSGLGGGTTTNNASMQMSVIHGAQTDSTQFTGFTIIGSTTATGVVSIYGYQKE